MLDYPFLDYMPVDASTWGADVDWMNNWITNVSVLCTVIITGVMLYFAIKYRASTHPKPTSKVNHSALLETVWTVVPSIIVIYVFYVGFVVYEDMRNPPANSVEVTVTGYRWAWAFTYENGKSTTNELVVPVDEPVRLVMKSKDVIHSFFIPAMRIKEDVRADRYSFLWFHPTITSADQPGGYFPVFCAEYCGRSHSEMLAKLRVVTREEYNDFLHDRSGEDLSKLTPVQRGEKLYIEKACNTCHSLDGSVVLGPTFKDLFGKLREFETGNSVTCDENYLKESILYSTMKIVKGFGRVMPAFEGLLKDEEVDDLVAFIKAQSESKQPEGGK